jgi:hypothetical protein
MLLAALVVVLMNGAADAAEGKYSIIGVGTGSCGTWTAARRDRRALLYEQWILGFLSGEGAASAVLADGSDNPLNGMDAEGVWAWIDTYCQVHPLDQILRGGQKLGLERDQSSLPSVK